jgi:anti-sigma B factor antagonist
MKVTIANEEDVCRVAIEGSIDGKTAPVLQEELQPKLQTAAKVLMDMSGVDYMSSAGLRLLLLLYRSFTAKKGKLVLFGLSPEIRAVMAHTGFLSFFTVADDAQQAATAFAG